MSDITINIDTWIGDRQLDFCPKHFIMATTPITTEIKFWVLEKLHGRFYVSANTNFGNRGFLFEADENIYFEDSQEAVLYELTWS